MQLKLNIPGATENVKLLFDPQYADHLPCLGKATELFFIIKDLQPMKGWAFAQLKWWTTRLGVSKKHVIKLIKILRNAGLIEVKRREQNFYRINPLMFPSSSLGREDRPVPSRAARQDRYQRRQGEPLPKAADLVKEVSPEKAAAIIADYQADLKTRSVEASSTVVIEQAVGMATAIEAVVEEAIEPEVKAAVEEAAKQVKREHRDKPKSIRDYLEKVKDRLADWKIDAPSLLISDVALARWINWGW